MKAFTEWFEIRESSAEDSALLNYLSHVEAKPNVDDIKTLLSMMKQTRDKRQSGIFPEMFKRIKRLVFKIPEIKLINAENLEIINRLREEIKDTEEEIYKRQDVMSGKVHAGGYKEETPADMIINKLRGPRNNDFNFADEVYKYLKDNMGIDLYAMDEDDPLLEKAHDMIIDQHDTGVLDVRTIAEKVADFIRKNTKWTNHATIWKKDGV